jgi:hypothetical protein
LEDAIVRLPFMYRVVVLLTASFLTRLIGVTPAQRVAMVAPARGGTATRAGDGHAAAWQRTGRD